MSRQAAPTIEELEPSSDIDAEAAVLSAVMLDTAALPKIVDFLHHDHFLSEAHRRIFEAARELFFAKEPVDAQTIASWLRERDRLKQIGGMPYLVQILDASPAVSNVRAHATKIHDAWRRRQVMLAAKRVAAESSQGDARSADVQTWCESVVKRMGEISLMNPVRPIESNEQVLARILQQAFDVSVPTDPNAVPMTGFPTGIYGLDRLLGGLRKAAKTTVAAGTGVGKTAFAIQCALAVAKAGGGVLMFSKEMKREELMKRALVQEAGVSSERIRTKTLRARDRQALLEANERLKNLPFIVDDTARITIEQLSAATRAAKETMLMRYRVPLVMVIDDNVNRAEPSRHFYDRGKHEQLGHHTKNFKILCQEEDIVGLELAQAKEGTAPGRKAEKPRGNSAIADSSQIGKEADDIIYLWEVQRATPQDPRTELLAIVAKNRAGPKGEVTLEYRGDMFRFRDPNAPGDWGNPSRQYVDQEGPDPEDRESPLTEGLALGGA